MARLTMVVIEPFAEWECAVLGGMARDLFGDEVRWLSVDGRPVASYGNLRIAVDGAFDDAFDPASTDAVLVIGSDGWFPDSAPDIAAPLRAAAAAGCVIGGICGGVLPLARAGLLDQRRHTGNSAEVLRQRGGRYAGEGRYLDGPQAASDGRVVTARGESPVTFAAEVLRLLHPDAADRVARMASSFGAEFAAGR